MQSQQNQPSSPTQRDEKRLEALRQIRQQALVMVVALMDHADAQGKIQKRIKLANYAVAALVMLGGFLSYTEGGKQLSAIAPILISLLGAIFLLVDAYTPHFLDDPNPERFRDYAFYIQKFARDIETHVANNDLSDVHWTATADLLSDWTRTNMDDVSLKFSKVRKRIGNGGLPTSTT